MNYSVDFPEIEQTSVLLSQCESKISQLYNQIGKHYVDVYRYDCEEEFIAMVESVAELEQQISSYHQQLREIEVVYCCDNCGAEVPAEAAFCCFCGASLSKSAKPEIHDDYVHCPDCGTLNGQEQSHCAECGCVLSDAVVPISKYVEPNQRDSTTMDYPVFCRHCGHKIISKDNLFCDHCGSKLKAEYDLNKDFGVVCMPNSKRKPTSLIIFLLILILIFIGVGIFAWFYFQKKSEVSTVINPPKYSVESGYYSEAQFIQISVDDEQDLKVYFTTDGTMPDKESNEYVYGNKIAINTTMTIKSVAVEKNGNASAVSIAEYVIGDNDTSIGKQPEQRYIFVIKDITWEKAQEECVNRGGHLVTFESENEFDTVLDYIEQRSELENKRFYIGGSREINGRDYKWVNEVGKWYGSSLNSSSHWLPGDPSYKDGDIEETCMMLYYYNQSGTWVWADVPNDVPGNVADYIGKVGYICEID